MKTINTTLREVGMQKLDERIAEYLTKFPTKHFNTAVVSRAYNPNIDMWVAKIERTSSEE